MPDIGLCSVQGCPHAGVAYALVCEGAPGNWRDEAGLRRAFILCPLHVEVLAGLDVTHPPAREATTGQPEA
jgi:hypothetical protein